MLAYAGPVHVVWEASALPAAVEALRAEQHLGFDTETRPAFRKGESYDPSLLQLAGEREVWLFQVQRLPELKELFALLADPAILKSGVAIDRDIKELQVLSSFQPAGFEDVGEMAKERGFRQSGLRPLTAMLLDGRLSKSAQTSNWAAKELSAKQIRYAATDAWVSRLLHQKMREIPLPEPKEES